MPVTSASAISLSGGAAAAAAAMLFSDGKLVFDGDLGSTIGTGFKLSDGLMAEGKLFYVESMQIEGIKEFAFGNDTTIAATGYNVSWIGYAGWAGGSNPNLGSDLNWSNSRFIQNAMLTIKVAADALFKVQFAAPLVGAGFYTSGAGEVELFNSIGQASADPTFIYSSSGTQKVKIYEVVYA